MLDNADAGITVLESSACTVYNNRVVNHYTGVQVVVGAEYNLVFGNVFENNTGKLYMSLIFFYFDKSILLIFFLHPPHLPSSILSMEYLPLVGGTSILNPRLNSSRIRCSASID